MNIDHIQQQTHTLQSNEKEKNERKSNNKCTKECDECSTVEIKGKNTRTHIQ